MTREEAIDIIKCLAWHTRPNEEDVEQAIKALKQEPTTKNDLVVDCISRQYVLDKIQRLVNAEQNNIDENGDYMNYARERVNAYEAVQFFVENDCLCPSVTPQEPVLDRVKAEIERQYKWLLSAEATTYNIDIAFDAIRKAVEGEKE